MKKLLLILSTTLLGLGAAHASFMIEPYVGLEKGTYSSGGADIDFSGTDIGARLGYSVLGFTFGADYMMASMTEKPSGGDVKAKNTDMGVFAGYQFPIMLQAYLTYFLSSELDADNQSDNLKGSGTRIGVGYTGLPFVVINFEMIKRTYTKLGSVDLSNDAKYDSYAINVSLPLP
ncbi:MAG: hypothetical protein ABL927_00260 [Bdellovibrionales bacterium]